VDTKQIKEMDRSHVIYSWAAQKNVNPIIMDHAEGIYQWDTDGKKYIDFCSGLLNINIGHNEVPDGQIVLRRNNVWFRTKG